MVTVTNGMLLELGAPAVLLPEAWVLSLVLLLLEVRVVVEDEGLPFTASLATPGVVSTGASCFVEETGDPVSSGAAVSMRVCMCARVVERR